MYELFYKKKSPETVTISLTAGKLKKIYQNVRVMPQWALDIKQDECK